MAKQSKVSLNENEFLITNEEGKIVKCEVLFTFESEKTHKNYIVYTDDSVDDDGNTKVYASTYEPEDENTSLKPIESDEEWKMIEEILDEIQESIEEETEEHSDDDVSSEKTKSSISYDKLVKCIEDKRIESEKLDTGILEDIASILETETDEEHIDYLFKVLNDNNISDCSFFASIGAEAYSNDNFAVAEDAFRRAETLCEEDVQRVVYANNLAYLLRRKEIRNPQSVSGKEIVKLLKQGVAKKDTFALINMALFWALNIGAEDDWKMADELISLVSKSDVHGAYLWWLDVGNKDDVEGHLVHLLLIRNGKIAKSPLGEMKALFDKVKAKYAAIPAEFKNIVTPFDGGTTDTLPRLDDWL